MYQSLAVFRLVSFAMGTGLVFMLNPSDQQPIVLGMVVILVGSYNVYSILWRPDPARPKVIFQSVSLGIDVVLSFTLIVLSGGLDSPFLIYSLSPILTASLLMDLGFAVAVAGILALAVSGVHILGGFGIGTLPAVLSRNYLVLALLYSAVCLLIVNLPFLANLNWHRRVRSESLASERQRLRREVHDNVAQTLAFLSLKMKLAEQRVSRGRTPITPRDVTEIGSVVERAYLAVRDYLDGTDEEISDPLAVRLAVVAEQWSRDTGLPVKISTVGEEGKLEDQVKFQLLQVTREALANVAKHAYPTNTWVEMECTDEEIKIRVRDDGRGFAISGLRGHGIGIMNERTAMAGATLDINSTPGEGTEVTVAYSRNAAQEVR
ncbi:MAG: hypothetical protein IH962_02010 [Chloroflexi bacterium]|nr:hypothetical protein [Chloroflexota bacterium]